MAARDLTEDKIIAREIDEHQRWSALSDLQVRLGKRNDDNFAGYKSCHAASSSCEFHSRARTESLRRTPLNGSSAILVFRLTAKS